MSLLHMGLILLFLILFLTGLLVIIRSKIINNWLFNLSVRFLNGSGFGDIPNIEGQRQAQLWIIRAFSFIFMGFCILALISLFSDIHW
jgi:hypothetical protein